MHLCFGQTISIIAVGDVLLHKPLQTVGKKNGFSILWLPLQNEIQSADISYANLEGPAAKNIHLSGRYIEKPHNDTYIYTSYPRFNYPPQVVNALKGSGFDIVSTANNHSLDRFAIGIEQTIRVLDQSNLAFIGTRDKNHRQRWVRILSHNGIKTAWIACTQDTNGIKDKFKQVLYCFKDKELILKEIESQKNKVDLIILTPHWGTQYQFKPNAKQKKLAKAFLEKGAHLVLGSHPHVVQPIETYQTKDGRTTLIAYSLGNFVSNQGSLKNRASGLLKLTIKKVGNNQIEFKEIIYYPTYMKNRGGQMQLSWIKSKTHPGFRLLKKQIPSEYLKIYPHI